MPFGNLYRGRRVLVTGHTGFKGAWLSEWLLALGADVTGVALDPPTRPSLFDMLDLRSRMSHNIADIRDGKKIGSLVHSLQPDFVFHLAAQSLVRESYSQPVDTWSSNVIGTINVLETLREVSSACAAVFVTSDKCYDNRESSHPYSEDDALGGADPYSSSKAAAELAIGSWRRSFFINSKVAIASGRAGNVVGGGDWATHRLVPDCIRALQAKQQVGVRNPGATRPWQHVLEPLSGYLHLAARLYLDLTDTHSPDSGLLKSAFNFGPSSDSTRSVREVVETVLGNWPGTWVDQSDPSAVHEAEQLRLSIDKAANQLDWSPIWDFDETISRTVTWYRSAFAGSTAAELTSADIRDYVAAARSRNVGWSYSQQS